MSLERYIDEHGLTCCACRTDVSSGGVAPGDGRLYCAPCHRVGAGPAERLELPGQQTLELAC